MGKFRIIPSIYLYNGNVVDKETKEIVGMEMLLNLPLSIIIEGQMNY